MASAPNAVRAFIAYCFACVLGSFKTGAIALTAILGSTMPASFPIAETANFFIHKKTHYYLMSQNASEVNQISFPIVYRRWRRNITLKYLDYFHIV